MLTDARAGEEGNESTGGAKFSRDRAKD
jgi:hypothetical protein